MEGMDRLEIRVKPFEDATPFLPRPERLQAVAERDGFVYLHKLVPEDVILALRGVVLDYAREAGCSIRMGGPARPSRFPADGWADIRKMIG